MKQFDFKLELLKQLLGRPSGRSRTPVRPAATSSPARPRPSVVVGHTITKVGKTPGGRNRVKRCKQCTLSGVRRRDSLYQCAVCQVGLCPECFDLFHTL